MAVSFFKIKCYVQLYLLVLHFPLSLKKSFSFQFQQHVEIDHQMFQELISIMNPIYEYFTWSSWSVFLLFIALLSMLIQGHFLISLISKAGWEAVLINLFTLNILTKIHVNTVCHMCHINFVVRIWCWIKWYSPYLPKIYFLFSCLGSFILYWYYMEKFCLGHSLE